MKTVLIFFIACVCVSIAQEDLKEARTENGTAGELQERVSPATTIYQHTANYSTLKLAISGLRQVGQVARMFAALSGAFEMLIYIFVQNFVDIDIPFQLFNLLQIGFYFASPK